MNEQRAQVDIAAFADAKEAGLPPLECCRGTSPPRDPLELHAELPAAMPCDLSLELTDELVQVLEVLGQPAIS